MSVVCYQVEVSASGQSLRLEKCVFVFLCDHVHMKSVGRNFSRLRKKGRYL